MILNIHYKTEQGDFMDILGVNEIDTESESINNVYRVDFNGQTYNGNEARQFIREMGGVHLHNLTNTKF